MTPHNILLSFTDLSLILSQSIKKTPDPLREEPILTAFTSDLVLQFWGVRGSIAKPPENNEIEDKLVNIIQKAASVPFSSESEIREFIRKQAPEERGIIGGNTSCVYIKTANSHIIFDAGTGIRPLGEALMEQEFGEGQGVAHIFLSHTHWDHIAGFPFFKPAYIPGNQIFFYGCHNSLERRISYQQEDEFFPVSLSAMAANIDFVNLKKESSIKIDKIKISNTMLNHPGGSFGYRVEYKGKSIVYATDSEYKDVSENKMAKIRKFFAGADLLIFDSHFTIHESIEKENWGHSTAIQGVHFAHAAKNPHLVLFHHNPEYSDHELINIYDHARLYAESQGFDLEITLAYEGLEFTF